MQIPAARAKTATVLKLYRNIWRELKGERRVFVGAILLLVDRALPGALPMLLGPLLRQHPETEVLAGVAVLVYGEPSGNGAEKLC